MSLGIGAQMIRENNINKKTYDIIRKDIKDKLTKMLIREKRLDLFENCMKVITTLIDMEIAGFKISTFEH